jgi:hypothetical protein
MGHAVSRTLCDPLDLIPINLGLWDSDPDNALMPQSRSLVAG